MSTAQATSNKATFSRFLDAVNTGDAEVISKTIDEPGAASTTVLIVGAGPTGLTLACRLAQLGVPYRIIDRAAEPAPESRATLVHAATLEILDELGVAATLISHGRRLDRIRFTDAGRTLVRIGFDRIPSRYRFALGVPQSTTEQVLIGRLADLGGTVEREQAAESLRAISGGYRVSGRRPDGRPFAVTARYVVGADGAHSMVRQAIGLDFPGQTYQQQFLLADVALAGQPCADNEAMICTSPRGVVVLGRLPGGTWRVVATMPASAQVPQRPGRAQIGQLLRERGIAAEPAAEPVWASRFRVQHRAAARFRDGGVLLCGDAAHVHSPAAGQGMNTGIADAYDLAERLAAVTAGRADESLLHGYDRERRAAAAQVLAFTDRMTKLASLRSAPARALRNLALRTLTRIPAIRAAITMQVTGLARSPLQRRPQQPSAPTPHPGAATR